MLLDWSQCPAVEVDPKKQGGSLVFKGTRTPVWVMFANLGDMNTDELIEEFGFEREQIEDVLQFLAESTEAHRRTSHT
jgi:uncharacterized protein (DUF433 family)